MNDDDLRKMVLCHAKARATHSILHLLEMTKELAHYGIPALETDESKLLKPMNFRVEVRDTHALHARDVRFVSVCVPMDCAPSTGWPTVFEIALMDANKRILDDAVEGLSCIHRMDSTEELLVTLKHLAEDGRLS